MSVYPFLRLSRTALFTDSLYSVNCQRFSSGLSSRWSSVKGDGDNYVSTPKYKFCNTVATDCLTTSIIVNQLSSPIFGLIYDLTRRSLSSLYLTWYSMSRSFDKSWLSPVNYFSDEDKKRGPFGGQNPFEDQFSKFTKDLPPLLMHFIDPITTPGPILSLKNLYKMFFIIKPTYDSSFDYQAFLDGAKQALCVITDSLSRGETSTLEGLIEPEALSEVQENLVKFTPSQLADLKADESDIVIWYAKEISTIERDDRKFVEMTVIYHVNRGYQEKMASPSEKPRSFFIPDNDITFCNYRFIREYTKGVEGSWTCNRLNHFKWGHFIKNSPFGS